MSERLELLVGLIVFVLGTFSVLVLIRWFLHSTITLGIKNASEKQDKCGNEEIINGNSRVGLKTCENCERIIGKLEQPYIYNNKIVCKECSKLLNNEKDDV
jgi:hypothetical protein